MSEVVTEGVSKLGSLEVKSMIGRLREIISVEELDQMQPSGPAAVYTTLTTLWLMVLQRLGGGLSMQAVLKDAIAHAEDIFPACKRVRESTLSGRAQLLVTRVKGSKSVRCGIFTGVSVVR